jgi:hypothetical protein
MENTFDKDNQLPWRKTQRIKRYFRDQLGLGSSLSAKKERNVLPILERWEEKLGTF